MKLWDKGLPLSSLVEAYTVGDDYLLDQRLVPYDCRGSEAHVKMLESIGILTPAEAEDLRKELEDILHLHSKGEFKITREDEDCHTAIEGHLVSCLGSTGEKIHTGRSRNDQVLTALRLYEKDALAVLEEGVSDISGRLEEFRNAWGKVPLPGYTHMRRAMPTDFGTWAGAFIDAFSDDQVQLTGLFHLIDQSPLGTAAGFGVPVLDLDRELAAREMGFSRVQENPVYAQMSRGKFESAILHQCGQIVFNLNKMATDLILFSMSEFGFVTLDPEICTGSSIMPQKKNPDVLELVRGQYHIILGEEFKLKSLISNLMSGYNRDIQLTKGPLFRGLDATIDSLRIISHVLPLISVEPAKCTLSDELFATEKVYRLVKAGVPFREAYRIVATKQ
jgi:argininosuccinate lyase